MARTVDSILKTKDKLIGWSDTWKQAFGDPTPTGLWFIWGNSGNGKSSFCMQLMKELVRKKKRVFFNSLEEGTGPTIKKQLLKFGMGGLGSYLMIDVETLEELDQRMSSPKAPHVLVLDSIQVSDFRTDTLRTFLKKHSRTKLIIIVSQADGKNPRGKTAQTARYLADLKIWVEGHKAISHGRYNPGGEFIVWTEGAAKHWGAIKHK